MVQSSKSVILLLTHSSFELTNCLLHKHINEDGFPQLDTYVKEGDCLIGKVLVSKKKGTVKNSSLMCGLGEEGYIDRIIVTKEKDKGSTYIKIKQRRYLKRKSVNEPNGK